MSTAGYYVVQGTAGSGKTVMAIVRAGHLVRSATMNGGPTLLITHTNSLVTYLRHLADGEAQGVVIETYAKFARGYLAGRGRMGWNSIAGDEADIFVKLAIAEKVAEGSGPRFWSRPFDFFKDELDWIDGVGLETQQDYLAAVRSGRKEPLRDRQRSAVWRLRERYLEIRNDHSFAYDWSSLPREVHRSLLTDASARRYRHIVVDEAQDLSPEAIRSLAAAIQPGGSLTLFVDESQQIYGQRTSWRSCGLTNVRIESFTDNYRNTPQIAGVALAMASMPHFQDSPDIVMPIAPRRAAGTKPTLFKALTSASLAIELTRQATTLGQSARIAVLAQTRADARRVAGSIPGAQLLSKDMPAWDDSPGVYFGTFYAAKGLEFEIVILPFVDASLLPSGALIEAFGEIEARARASRQLYVGVTRARTELLLGYVDELTTLLPPSTDTMWQEVVER
jgi:superfamily I DNA/RNA helicase